MFSKGLLSKGYGQFFRTVLPTVTRIKDTIEERTSHKTSETAGSQLPVNNIMERQQPNVMIFKSQHTSPTEIDAEKVNFDSLNTMAMKYSNNQ